MDQPQQSFYDAVGGAATFRAIVARFCALAAEDEILHPLYPREDMDAAGERLRMFLEQYWGGPRSYAERRGRPRLRMRHLPFRIGPTQRDAWLRCMQAAVDAATLNDRNRRKLLEYLETTAQSLVNAPS